MSKQYFLPEAGYFDESSARSHLVADSHYVVDTSAAVPVDVTVSPSVLSLTGAVIAPTISFVTNVTVTPSASSLVCGLPAPIMNNIVSTAKQYLIPEVGFVNETGIKDFLIPGADYVNEILVITSNILIRPTTLSITSSIQAPSPIVPRQRRQYLDAESGFVNESAKRNFLIPDSIFAIEDAPIDITISVSESQITCNVSSVIFPIGVPQVIVRKLVANADYDGGIEKSYILKSKLGAQ